MPDEERVANEIEITAKYGADLRADQPHWTVVYRRDLEQWAKRLRGEA
jgi:hypothetical protein